MICQPEEILKTLKIREIILLSNKKINQESIKCLNRKDHNNL